MKYILIILTTFLLSSCSSLPEKIEVQNELHIPKIILPNAPVATPLEDYEIISITIDKIGLTCLDGVNFKTVSNNDNKQEAYIIELENQLNYLREVIRKQNVESENNENK